MKETFIQAVSLAEQGLFVIYSMKAPSVTNALRRGLSMMNDRYGNLELLFGGNTFHGFGTISCCGDFRRKVLHMRF